MYTSDRKKNAEIALINLGLKDYFTYIIGGDSVNKPKPWPDGIIDVCKRVKVNPKNSAYISDTTGDLIMAKHANVLCKIGVETGLDNNKDLTQYSDIVFNNFFDFDNYFYQNG